MPDKTTRSHHHRRRAWLRWRLSDRIMRREPNQLHHEVMALLREAWGAWSLPRSIRKCRVGSIRAAHALRSGRKIRRLKAMAQK